MLVANIILPHDLQIFTFFSYSNFRYEEKCLCDTEWK